MATTVIACENKEGKKLCMCGQERIQQCVGHMLTPILKQR